MDSHSKRVKFQEYLQRGFLNVTNKVFGKERQGEKRLWNNFLVNERAGQTVCIYCWKEFSLIRPGQLVMGYGMSQHASSDCRNLKDVMGKIKHPTSVQAIVKSVSSKKLAGMVEKIFEPSAQSAAIFRGKNVDNVTLAKRPSPVQTRAVFSNKNVVAVSKVQPLSVQETLNEGNKKVNNMAGKTRALLTDVDKLLNSTDDFYQVNLIIFHVLDYFGTVV